MTGSRASWARMLAVAEQLSDRDKEIIRALAQVRMLTGHQLEGLIFYRHPPNARNHIRRRVLYRLIQLGIVTTLERRIGGVRAGSSGLIYCLDRLGQRIADFLNGSTPHERTRSPHTPGVAFLAHTLAVSQAFVSLATNARERSAHLRTFLTEPGCWWPDGNGGMLRPDALVIVEDDTYEAATWLEIDQGSEHLGRIRGKLRAYDRFARGGNDGPAGLLPRVVFAAPDDGRTAAIAREIARHVPQYIGCEAVPQLILAPHILGQLST